MKPRHKHKVLKTAGFIRHEGQCKKDLHEESKLGRFYVPKLPSKPALDVDDSDQNEDEFDFDTTRESSQNNWKKSLFIIQCIRLGMDDVSEEYYSSIKRVFDIPQCVGIMGGRRNKALYFVGHEGDNLVFLDPHYVSDAIPSKEAKHFELESYT